MKNLEKIIFCALIALLPLQIGQHFWPEFSFIYSLRVDYLSPTLYLTDILLGLVLLVGFYNRWLPIKNPLTILLQRHLLICVLLTVSCLGYLVFSVQIAINLGAYYYKVVKLLEMGLFIVYLTFSIKTRKQLKLIAILLLCGALSEGLLAHLEFFQQTSLNLWFLGERNFSKATPQIAQVILDNGRLLLRPYATFPHPNVLAGFLVILLPLFVWLATQTTSKKLRLVNIVAVLFLITTIFITFSRTAWIIVSILVINFFIQKFNWKGTLALVATIALFFWLSGVLNLISTRFLSLVSSDALSITRRSELNDAALKMWQNSPLVGVGFGNFLPQLSQSTALRESPLWLQPAHNIFLLIAAETGIIGIVAFLALILYSFCSLLKRYRENDSVAPFLADSLAGIIFLGLFDHYFWTLQQGQLLLALILGLSLAKIPAKG